LIKLTIPGKRNLNFTGAAVCTGMMGFAFYAQYRLLLDPCPLCILQRVAVISLGIVFLLAALHNPSRWGDRVYGALLALVTIAGAAVAGWHVRLQNLPAEDVPSCGPGLDYMLENFPLGDALQMVFKGSGECAEVVWRLFGLSMPSWVLIGVLVTGGCGIWNNLRRG